MVLGEGLEPSRLTAPEPKSGVSANFTTRAFKDRTVSAVRRSMSILALTIIMYNKYYV